MEGVLCLNTFDDVALLLYVDANAMRCTAEVLSAFGNYQVKTK